MCIYPPAVTDAVPFGRPEYVALAEEFVALSRAFGDAPDAEARDDLAVLTAAIDCIDRTVDAHPSDPVRRASLWRDVDRGLSPEPDRGEDAELDRAVRSLRALAERRGVLPRVRRIVAAEARTSEALRVAPSARAYVNRIAREGKITAALALVISGTRSSRAFRAFLLGIAAPANLVDKIVDAREDHARREMHLPPGAHFYARLGGALVARGLAVLWRSRRPLLVARLAWRYLGPWRPC